MTWDHFHVGKSCGISFGGEIFSIFRPIQRIFMEIITQNSPDSERKKKNLPDFYDMFLQVAKNLEWYPNFLLFYLSYSQIWLNLLIDDCQFGYIRKLKLLNTVEMAYNIGYTSVE
jgi:hypothetical protein